MRAASAARSKRRNRSLRRCGVRGRFSRYSSVQHARPTCDVAVCMSCNKSQDKTRHGAFMFMHYMHTLTLTHTHNQTHNHTNTHTKAHTSASPMYLFALSRAPCQWKPRLRRTHVCQRLRILATQNSSSPLSLSLSHFFSFRLVLALTLSYYYYLDLSCSPYLIKGTALCTTYLHNGFLIK